MLRFKDYLYKINEANVVKIHPKYGKGYIVNHIDDKTVNFMPFNDVYSDALDKPIKVKISSLNSDISSEDIKGKTNIDIKRPKYFI